MEKRNTMIAALIIFVLGFGMVVVGGLWLIIDFNRIDEQTNYMPTLDLYALALQQAVNSASSDNDESEMFQMVEEVNEYGFATDSTAS
jgi:hypothetical protein